MTNEIPSPSGEARATTVSLAVDPCEGMAKPAAGDASDSQHRLCACGCGQPTSLITANNRSKGLVAGTYRHFATGHSVRARWLGHVPEYREEDRGFSSPCWIWQRSLDRAGYANVASGKGYKLYYERAHGPVPKGLHLDHLCRQRACVNPDHLEPVTQAENNRRSVAARRAGRWSYLWVSCISCGGVERRHYAHGLCRRCYKREESRRRRAA